MEYPHLQRNSLGMRVVWEQLLIKFIDHRSHCTSSHCWTQMFTCTLKLSPYLLHTIVVVTYWHVCYPCNGCLFTSYRHNMSKYKQTTCPVGPSGCGLPLHSPHLKCRALLSPSQPQRLFGGILLEVGQPLQHPVK